MVSWLRGTPHRLGKNSALFLASRRSLALGHKAALAPEVQLNLIANAELGRVDVGASCTKMVRRATHSNVRSFSHSKGRSLNSSLPPPSVALGAVSASTSWYACRVEESRSKHLALTTPAQHGSGESMFVGGRRARAAFWPGHGQTREEARPGKGPCPGRLQRVYLSCAINALRVLRLSTVKTVMICPSVCKIRNDFGFGFSKTSLVTARMIESSSVYS